MLEILTPAQMGEADRLAIASGPFDGLALMRRAGSAVAALVLQRFGSLANCDVLCGPGNNGGDGYIVAERLRQAGMTVRIFTEGSPREGSDAALAAAECLGPTGLLGAFEPLPGTVVVDALYGAGLARAVSPDVVRAVARVEAAGCSVVAVDLPSGISGDTGRVMGAAFKAKLTVTFVRRKPGHLLQPGRERCGQTIVSDIGIPDTVVAEVGVSCFENRPDLWLSQFPSPLVDAHKYSRGHAAVVSGGAFATGAARLSAMAAARAGAGAVTMLSPEAAMQVNAAHLTSIMLRQAESAVEIADFMRSRRVSALVYGPGLEPSRETADTLLEILTAGGQAITIADAGALTALASGPEAFFQASRNLSATGVALTPHEGEFSRLFKDLAGDAALSKVDRARLAAKRANAVVVYKGPDTVIAAPDGRAAINLNGTPWLATAGSGDVLAGIIAGLAAQAMPLFEACCAAVWLHAEAAERFGAGLIAEDIPLALVPVLAELNARRSSTAWSA